MLTMEDKQKIQIWIDKFPKKQGALTMALRIVQDRLGWLPEEALDAVADFLELEKVQVYEVASFYGMFRLEPCGKHQIKVCNSLSCCLAGSQDLLAYLEKQLNTQVGEINPEGIFLGETECLGACTQAPVVLVDDKRYVEGLTPKAIDQLIAELGENVCE